MVQLSEQTLPTPSRGSGTYAWVLTIIVLTSYFAGFGLYLFVFKVRPVLPVEGALLAALVSFAVVAAALDRMYFNSSEPPAPRDYGMDSERWTGQ